MSFKRKMMIYYYYSMFQFVIYLVGSSGPAIIFFLVDEVEKGKVGCDDL